MSTGTGMNKIAKEGQSAHSLDLMVRPLWRRILVVAMSENKA